MQRICVFAGSSQGNRAEYIQGTESLGKELVRRGLGLVYGGGAVGLMNILANSVLEEGGEVVGVIPRALVDREVEHRGLTELHEVSSMHERKALMADLADGFIALPGGFGTFDELFEILTWAQLGIHQKPIGILNIAGYFDPLLHFIQHVTREGFIHSAHLILLHYETEPGPLLEKFSQHSPSIVSKWSDRPQR